MGSRPRFARRVRGTCGVREIRCEAHWQILVVDDEEVMGSGFRRCGSGGRMFRCWRGISWSGWGMSWEDVADFSEGALKVLMD